MVQWMCIVPGCKSNSTAPGHFFPKNPTLSQKWKEIVNNNIILNAPSEELRRYRVCHLHFLPEDYVYSQQRRRLKYNAVPSVNISNTETVNTEINDTNVTEQHSQSVTSTTEAHLQYDINFCKTMDKSKIRVIFEYEFRRGTDTVQTAQNINNVFSENVANEHTVRQWFDKFRSGDFNLENQPYGQPETKVDNDALKAVVEADTSHSTSELAVRFNVTIPTILDHLKQIGKIKKLNRWVPYELNEHQKRNRLESCFSLLSRYKREPFLHRIIMSDEKWILFNNRKRSAEWLDTDEAMKHSPKPNIHQRKLMVSVWWSSAGIIHYSFMKPDQSISADVYCNQLDEVMRQIAIKQPSLLDRDGPILLQDNARPHITQTTLFKLQKLDLEILYHPPYSPDLAPTDYHIFRALDDFLQGKMFNSPRTVGNAFREFIATRPPGFFAIGINDLPLRWQNCVDSLGAYFE